MRLSEIVDDGTYRGGSYRSGTDTRVGQDVGIIGGRSGNLFRGVEPDGSSSSGNVTAVTAAPVPSTNNLDPHTSPNKIKIDVPASQGAGQGSGVATAAGTPGYAAPPVGVPGAVVPNEDPVVDYTAPVTQALVTPSETEDPVGPLNIDLGSAAEAIPQTGISQKVEDYGIPTNLRPAAQKILDQMDTGGLTRADIQAALDAWVETRPGGSGEEFVPPGGIGPDGKWHSDADGPALRADGEYVPPGGYDKDGNWKFDYEEPPKATGAEAGATDTGKQDYITKTTADADKNGQDIINGGFVVKPGKPITNKATEHDNQVIAARAREQLAALNSTMTTAGIVNVQTGTLTELGYRLQQGDDTAWVKAIETLGNNAGTIALMGAILAGIITAPAWFPMVAGGLSVGLSAATIKATAATLGLGGLFASVAARADTGDEVEPGEVEGVLQGSYAYWSKDGSGYALGRNPQDHGLGTELNRLIDEVQELDNLARIGDPNKREERIRQSRNLKRIIRILDRQQREYMEKMDDVYGWYRPRTGPEATDNPLEPFGGKGPDIDYSHVPVGDLTSAQLNSELNRVQDEMKTPGITRERYKELEDRMMALKKQQRKNRRSNESLDRVSRARQLRS